mmetsp:Transcript_14532/g.34867  ORF Transcript_14532/g.34867 Transcript_14532/m.34867 type:complete len:191 (+) Transcript_14532:135-707(+)
MTMVSMMYREEDQLPEEPVNGGPLHERRSTEFLGLHHPGSTAPLINFIKVDDTSDPPALCKITRDLQRQVMEYGPNHIRVAKSLGALGLFRCHVKRDTLGAIQCHQEALRIYQQHFGAMDHHHQRRCTASMDIVVTLHDLGFCYERISDNEQAMEFYQKAIECMGLCVNVSERHPIRLALERSVSRLRRV